MKMWSLTSARTLLGLIAVSAVIQQGASQTTKQTLQYAASNLKMGVTVTTNHEYKQTFTVAFLLENVGTQPILTDDDWAIEISIKGDVDLTQSEFLVHGLMIKQTGGSYFEMSKKPGAIPKFPGIEPKRTFKITIQCKGYFVFKTSIQPNFKITGKHMEPVVIESTKDVNRGFVTLSPSNYTDGDPSHMMPYERFVRGPPMPDLGTIGTTMVVPRPRMLRFTNLRPGIRSTMDLSENDIYMMFDKSVSQQFRTFAKDKLTAMTRGRQRLYDFNPNLNLQSGLVIKFQLDKNDNTRTADGYKLAIIRPKTFPNGSVSDRPYNVTDFQANSEKGLRNGIETFLALAGEYDVIPTVFIDDDAAIKMRMVKVDLTQNYMGMSTLMKFLDLMVSLKFSHLVMVLGSDEAMRLQLEGKDFDELNWFGSEYSPARTEFYNSTELKEIIKYAASNMIDVIPCVNLIGSCRSAKKASHLRYSRLKDSNPTEARRLYLMSDPEPIMDVPAGSNYADGVLDPCHPPTHSLAYDMIEYFQTLYSSVDVPLTAFNAGGDEFTQYFGKFKSCRDMKLDQPAALNFYLNRLQRKLSNTGTKLMVHEHAVLDTTSGTCLQASNSVDKTNLLVEFTKMTPGPMDEWNLTPDQEAFLLKDVVPYNSSDPNSQQDWRISFIGSKKGMPPWFRAYDCFNSGYNGILSPDSFLNMNNADELDFDEMGQTTKKGFSICSLYQLMTWDPYNMAINMGITSTGVNIPPYRLAQVFEMKPLTAPNKVVGFMASLKTTDIRNEAQLFGTVLPKMAVISHRMWHRSPYEGLLKAEDPDTLSNSTLTEMRTEIMMDEYIALVHDIGYKECALWAARGMDYRISKIQAHLHNGMGDGRNPPWPLYAKTEIPGTPIEVLQSQFVRGVKVETWHPLRNPVTGETKLYAFPPKPSDSAVIRAASVPVTYKSVVGPRKGERVVIEAKLKNYAPKDVPVELRRHACLPITGPIDFEDLTVKQLEQILKNMDTRRREQNDFMNERHDALLGVLNTFNRANNQNFNYNETLGKMGMFHDIGVNFTALLNTDRLNRNNVTGRAEATVMRQINKAEIKIQEKRIDSENQKMQEWDRQFQRCRSRP